MIQQNHFVNRATSQPGGSHCLICPCLWGKEGKVQAYPATSAQSTQRKHNHMYQDQQIAKNIFKEQQNELHVLPFCLKYSAPLPLSDTKQPLNFKRSAGTNMQQFTSCTQSSTVTFQSMPLTNHFKSRAHSVQSFSPSLSVLLLFLVALLPLAQITSSIHICFAAGSCPLLFSKKPAGAALRVNAEWPKQQGYVLGESASLGRSLCQ